MTTTTPAAAPAPLGTMAEEEEKEEEAVVLDPHHHHNEDTPRTHNNVTTTMVASPLRERQQRTTSTTNGKRRHRHSTVGSWEDVARRGSRFKSFFQEAASEIMDHVVITTKRFKSNDENDDDDENTDKNEKENTTGTTTTTTSSTTVSSTSTATDNSSSSAPSSSLAKKTKNNTNNHPGFEHLNKLVEENYVENMQLRRKLDTAETERTTLATTQKSLRDEVNYWKNRSGRTSEALRIAEKNAANARADADLAETTAAQLAQTLQSLQTVVTETKLASQKLAEEQRQVDEKAANVETKYLQQKQELLRVTKDVQQLRQSNALLEHARDQWKQERKNLEQTVKHLQGTIETLRRQATDQAAVEALRKERAVQDQAELYEAQNLLNQATEHSETSVKVQATLQDTVQTLEMANAEMHEKMSEQQTLARTDAERLTTALTKAEREAQKLRLDKEAMEEELKRTKQDKEASAKQIQELKQRVITAERHKNHNNASTPTAANVATPMAAAESSPSNDDAENPPSNKIVFRLPPLPGSAKDKTNVGFSNNNNHSNPDVICGKSCCICFKPSFGIMKSCPCGNCQERAHIMCVKQVTAPPSVSHPGTPASPLPVFLCKLSSRRFSSAGSKK